MMHVLQDTPPYVLHDSPTYVLHGSPPYVLHADEFSTDLISILSSSFTSSGVCPSFGLGMNLTLVSTFEEIRV